MSCWIEIRLPIYYVPWTKDREKEREYPALNLPMKVLDVPIFMDSKKVTVVHIFVGTGHFCGNLSALRNLGRLKFSVNYNPIYCYVHLQKFSGILLKLLHLKV